MKSALRLLKPKFSCLRIKTVKGSCIKANVHEDSFYHVSSFPPLRMLIRLVVSLTIINLLFIIVGSNGKPADWKSTLGLVAVDPETSAQDSAEVFNDAVRVQRSPQGGFLNDDDSEDYSDDAEGRHLHKRKHKRKYHGGFGCGRKHGCGGWQGGYHPINGGHYPFHQQFGHGGSFASASGGFLGGGHHGFGGNGHANAQSGSFNFGPFGFNFAQAGAGSNRFF